MTRRIALSALIVLTLAGLVKKSHAIVDCVNGCNSNWTGYISLQDGTISILYDPYTCKSGANWYADLNANGNCTPVALGPPKVTTWQCTVSYPVCNNNSCPTGNYCLRYGSTGVMGCTDLGENDRTECSQGT